MALAVAIPTFVAGLILVVWSSERLVRGVVGTSLQFGVSSFLVSVVFLGFDPENLAVGAAGSHQGVAGIALGTILGSAMVAVALAFGITALLAPLELERSSPRIAAVPVGAVALLTGVSLDGRLGRIDGFVLLGAYAAAILYLVRLGRAGESVRAGGEVGESLEGDPPGRWRALAILSLSLVGVVVGAELVVVSSEAFLRRAGIDDTLFGMTALALLISIEELARELPAALRGRAEITVGNVVGSVLAFFLFNAGVIALVRPVPLGASTLGFYLPACLVTVLFVAVLLVLRRVPRWAGGVLLLLYAVFLAGGLL